MALVAMPLGRSDPIMQNLKHYIDLTEDSDSETTPASKRRKSSEIPEPGQAQATSSNAAFSVPRQATPVSQTKQAIKSKKVVTGPDSNVLITRSPFKNRPSWSKVNSRPSTQPNFSKASADQSEQPSSTVPPPRSTVEKGPAEISNSSERHEIERQPSHPKQQNLAVRPSTTSTAVAPPNKNASQDHALRTKNVSPSPKGFLPHTSSLRSKPLSHKAPSPTPLPDRHRNRSTASPIESPSTLQPASTSVSQISVVIDNSQRTFAGSTTANDLLSRFIQHVPSTGARPSVRATAIKEPAKNPEYRRRLLAELKKDASIVYSRASSVEAVFGPHGFSPIYSTKGDKVLRKQLAQPKARKIRRKEVKLDWGSSDTVSREPFEPKKLISPRMQAHEILSSRFSDATEPPITFVNDLNDKQLGGKFQFITSYIRRPGVEASPPEAINYGCDCIGGCKPDSCGCLVDDIEVDDFGDEINHGKIVPYQRVLDATGNTMSVLRGDYMKKSYADGEKSEIVECNPNCRCGADCWNRVVRKGRTAPLEIFMTAKCGFGLRSPQKIMKGQYIDLYLGEVITETELESRELATEGAPSYIFSLDWFQLKDVYYVDSLNFGTPTRFLNHSCNPNCRVFTVILNRADKKVYGLAFFATRDIPAGTELNIDYNPQEAGKIYPKPKPGDDDGVVLCYCGSRNCRVRLWPGPKMKKGKGWARN